MMLHTKYQLPRLGGGGGAGDPNFFLQIYFSWVQISLQVEFHTPGLPRSGRFIQALTLFKAGRGVR